MYIYDYISLLIYNIIYIYIYIYIYRVLKKNEPNKKFLYLAKLRDIVTSVKTINDKLFSS